MKDINEDKYLETLSNNGSRRDFTKLLPNEICIKIFNFLDIKSLSTCSIVCKSWLRLCRDAYLYKHLLYSAPWATFSSLNSTISSNSKCYKCLIKNYSWTLKSEETSDKKDETDIDSETRIIFCLALWYNEYKKQYQIYKNWLNGRYRKRTFTGHSSVVNCLVFNEERIISGSADSTIKVWNLHTNAQWSVQTLLGHSEAVRCLQLLHCPSTGQPQPTSDRTQRCPRDVQLVSGSNDRSIKIWTLAARDDWASIVCRATLTGHTDSVRCLQADHDKIVSGSYDGTLKIWCLHRAKLLNTLRGHKDAILCVQYDTNVIVSGSLDKSIKLWQFSGECIGTLLGHADSVACLHLRYNDDLIISGSHDNSLKFWSLAGLTCVRTINWMESEGHRRVVRCLQADHFRFVSGSDDKTIKVWTIEDGTRLHTFQGHTDGVSCLQFNNEMLVSGSYDHSVILWDFTVC